ncbi:MAG TPA: flagellar motor switch protein FliM [Phycisphaerae bacterium]|jgi:flagellar motor switch protein FliM|nr:flagellar motor switch protein FliM [Phycisphaerae bacterium]HOB74408.1 flagellar motor switch protein FliM [Phycisphaerae bacterium]HOJ54473.1 flagellar motor switch protein FliM [Phycisphaerae bacterium]HOL26502.1 flagellar motor switch protein FliM [Phycisphaerae bacterium]HPP20901.1 flagellar motor switch protein FliM [Phycisphaerae bacterium]
MADVLDQSEVDALLSAVDSGETLHDEPMVFGRGRQRQQEVRPYDFKRPERVSKDQMRALEAIHEGFARNFGASLSGFLRTIVEVRVATIEQLTYSEFIHSLPNPTCFNLLNATPLEGQLCLEISPLIVYPIIDRLLGGSNAELFIPQRPLTAIEWRLVKRITDRAMTTFTEVWSSLVPVKFELAETESNPHLVQIVAPNEVVVVIGFELKMGTRAGTMTLCLPFNVIEPVMGKLATQSWLAYQRRAGNDKHREQICTHLRSAAVNLRAFLAATTITVNDLIRLKPGDIIQTAKPATAELILQIENRNKYAGKLYQHKGARAIRITRRAEPDEGL